MKKVLSVMLVVCMLLSMNIFSYAVAETDGITEISSDRKNINLYDVKDLSEINCDYKKLRFVYFENCTIEGNEEIFNSPNIREIIFNNCIFTGDGVNFPAKLVDLFFDGSCPKTLSSLKACEKLSRFEVSECKFKDLSAFSNMGKIDNLRFCDCDIESISGIEKGNEINSLGFYKVPIESIEELKYMKGLRYLEISSTAVRDLSPLKNVGLYSLDISDSLLIENLDVIMEFDELYDMCTLNCQMLYTPEIIEFMKKRDISSNYKKGDLEMKEKVLSMCSEIERKYLTEEEKIGATVKKVCDMITYDYEVYSNDDLTMEYGNNIIKYALKGIGCCSTYTGMVAMMLNAMGIDCYSFSGNNHIWNLVEVDGYYYWLDATWIDTGWCEYLDESPYYMVTSEEFVSEHPCNCMLASVKNNPHSFDGVFKCDTRFKIEDDYVSEDYIEEKPTNPETTTQKDETTKEEKTTKVEKNEKVTEETKTEKATSEEVISENQNDRKLSIIIIVFVAVFGAVIAVVVIKKKNKPNS